MKREPKRTLEKYCRVRNFTLVSMEVCDVNEVEKRSQLDRINLTDHKSVLCSRCYGCFCICQQFCVCVCANTGGLKLAQLFKASRDAERKLRTEQKYELINMHHCSSCDVLKYTSVHAYSTNNIDVSFFSLSVIFVCLCWVRIGCGCETAIPDATCSVPVEQRVSCLIKNYHVGP